jgi:hypothetical protein
MSPWVNYNRFHKNKSRRSRRDKENVFQTIIARGTTSLFDFKMINKTAKCQCVQGNHDCRWYNSRNCKEVK